MPNPANGTTRIVFDLHSNSSVTITLHSLAGTEIRKLATGDYTAGIHEIRMDVSSLKSGMYFLSMVADHSQIVRKLIIQ